MIVMGIDPSLTDTGWAVLDMSKQGEDRLIDSGRIKTKSKEFFVVRYAKLREGIKEVVEKYKPDYVGIEIPPHNASWSAGLYPIWISFSEICFNHRIPFATFLPTRIKSYARGILDDSGKMFKSDMVDAAKMLLDAQTRMNHNIADAIIIGWLAWRFRLFLLEEIEEEDLTPREHHMFAKTVTKQDTGRVDKVGIIYQEGDKHYQLDTSKYDYLYDTDKDDE